MSAVFVPCWTFGYYECRHIVIFMSANVYCVVLCFFPFIWSVLDLPFWSVLKHRTAALPSTYQFCWTREVCVIPHPSPTRKLRRRKKSIQCMDFFRLLSFLVGEGLPYSGEGAKNVAIICCWRNDRRKNRGENLGQGAVGSVCAVKWRTGTCFDMTFIQFHLVQMYWTGHMELQNWSLQDQFPISQSQVDRGLVCHGLSLIFCVLGNHQVS